MLEFIQRTGRSHASPDEIYEISVEPSRVVEMAWPNVMGTPFQTSDYWGDLMKPPGRQTTGWVPTYYLGGLSLALALSSLAIRRGPPWRVWLTVIGSIGLLGCLGPFTSPIWVTRTLAVSSSSASVRGWLPDLGPLDPRDSTPIRHDGYLRDSDGSVYWWMATVLPGFRQFRYPAKLFTLTALAVTALAGLGWDRLASGRRSVPVAIFLALLVLSLTTLAIAMFLKQPILAALRTLERPFFFGPLDPTAGYQAIIWGLSHAAIVFGAGAGAHPCGSEIPCIWRAHLLSF